MQLVEDIGKVRQQPRAALTGPVTKAIAAAAPTTLQAVSDVQVQHWPPRLLSRLPSRATSTNCLPADASPLFNTVM